MKIFFIFCLLAVCLVAAPNYLSGTWRNELGSTMRLIATTGTLTGTYISAVGEAKGSYPLTGFYNTEEATTTVGWAVAWKNQALGDSHSLATWSGQLTTDGKISTIWLLTSLVTDPKNLWNSTKVGMDMFTRVA